MKNEKELVLVGKFVKTHALKGQLLLDPAFEFDKDVLDELVLIKGSVEKTYALSQKPGMNGSRLIISLKGLNKIEEAQPLVGSEVFADKDLFDEEELNSSPALLIGFQLQDVNTSTICEITNFFDLKNNPLLVVEVQGKEVLIPFHDDIVQEIDFDHKKVTALLPEGLIDVYLKPSSQKEEDED